ncbi:Uu.00g060470.m01.CDS01 [Anthostomella pinea]|uniref:Uu.00g060470.m01.CDS01 n=1 Tax=Anthostomella pinea TaxID=933095 RepID=A0AAI8VS97_9PEZI|nr:Uu.00g060470.m01.CDS01 [Anthostomella pinea]
MATFTVFQDLPTELRLGVWRQALHEEAKKRNILIRQADDHIQVVPSKKLVSTFLLVNRESRESAQRFYSTKLGFIVPEKPGFRDKHHLVAYFGNFNEEMLTNGALYCSLSHDLFVRTIVSWRGPTDSGHRYGIPVREIHPNCVSGSCCDMNGGQDQLLELATTKLWASGCESLGRLLTVHHGNMSTYFAPLKPPACSGCGKVQKKWWDELEPFGTSMFPGLRQHIYVSEPRRVHDFWDDTGSLNFRCAASNRDGREELHEFPIGGESGPLRGFPDDALGHICFYNRWWHLRGTKDTLRVKLSRITRISERVMRDCECLPELPVAEKMSWAARRVTTLPEDTAYCLVGIFDMNMPMLDGEGTKAFGRLQEEIIRRGNDMSIFAWEPLEPLEYMGVLAHAASEFEGFSHNNKSSLLAKAPEFAMTNKGIRITTPLWEVSVDLEVPRASQARVLAMPLSTSSNRGRQLLLLKRYAPGQYARLGLARLLSEQDVAEKDVTIISSNTVGTSYLSAHTSANLERSVLECSRSTVTIHLEGVGIQQATPQSH